MTTESALAILPEILKKIGLSEAEKNVYLTGLALGPALASALAEKSNVSRPLVYHALNELLEKGLVSKIGPKHGALFTVESPTRIKEVINRKHRELSSMDEEIDQVIRAFDVMSRVEQKAAVRVRFYNGTEGLKNIAAEVLDLAPEKIRSMANIPNILDAMQMEKAFLKYWFTELEKRGTKSLSLWSHRFVDENFRSARRELRIAPADITFSSNLLIYGDRIALFSGSRRIHAVVIEGGEFAQTMSMLFDQVWKKSKPIAQ